MTTVVTDKREQVEALCDRFHVETLEVFGSAAQGEFDPDASDIDLLVRFSKTTPELHAKRYFGLLAGLQDLFDREIDLVEIGAVTNPYFLKEIDSSRHVIYAAGGT